MLALQCELTEAAVAEGRPVDLDAYGRLVDRLGRTLSRLAVVKPEERPGLSLEAYLQAKASGSAGP